MPSVDSLVIGANGLVGRRVLSMLKAKGKSVSGTYNRRAEGGLIPLDITDAASLRRIFKDLAPRQVYLCANLSGGVDYCEKNPAQARRFYYDATVNVGNLCGGSGASLIFISTDYVFDGANGPYKEEDGKDPLNLYGKLKLEAEEWIRGNLEKHIIARTTNVFGWDPQTVTPNYVMNLYRTLKSGKPFNAPSYLWGNPTYAGDLAM
ncbi:MAG: sugar nucleotide-binding protein, partial [Dehalococcoidales bacterium]